MIKLNYKTMIVDGLEVHYAKYGKNRNIRLTVSTSGEIKITAPIYVTNADIINFVKSRKNWINKVKSKIDEMVPLGSEKKLNSKQKRELISRIDNYIGKYEILMGTKVEKFSVRSMRTLWGSCTYKERAIRFNSKLYYMSDYFLEYIVVHEMTHIFVHDHSPAFYDIVKKYLPDYKLRWKEHKNVRL